MKRLRLVVDRGLEREGLLGLTVPVVLVAAAIGLLSWGYVGVSHGGNYDVVISMGISGILVVGMQMFMGQSGITSFGHMAFMAIGAYAAGILSVPVAQKVTLLPGLPVVLQNHSFGILVTLIVGAVTAGLLGLVSGAVLMRLSGTAASITTLALLVITNEVLRNATSFTRGNQTFFGVPKSSNLVWVFGTLVLVTCIAMLFKESVLGLRARAVRDDPLAAETAGASILPNRLWSFVISAAVTGVGGALYAQYLTAFNANSFYVGQSVPIIVMLILGGVNSVLGGLTGTVLLTVWIEVMRRIESGDLGPLHFKAIPGIEQLSVGIMLILLLLWRPTGVWGAREIQFVRRVGKALHGRAESHVKLGAGQAEVGAQAPSGDPGGESESASQ
jgi:branched-chain amino acid transport system permease protein